MQFGICNLSIVPLRFESTDKSELVSQVLYGEVFKVLEQQKKWSKIRLVYDDYEGWIDNKQYLEIEESNYSELTKSEIANNAYSVGNEKLEAEFINNYTKAFNEIKRIIIDANQARIDQLTTTNSEIDDIDKFLDTVEPLKELELNNLREVIEKNEVEERYKIRYAKQRHEAKLMENNSLQHCSFAKLSPSFKSSIA